MQGYFWTNTIWYILLSMTSLAAFIAALIKAENRRFILAFMATLLGLFFFAEYVLVLITDAYEYYPMILPNDPFQDTVIGNLFSQTSIVTTCGLIIALKLKAKWYFIFAAAYFLVETAFVSLGIYEHHWYQTVYTAMLLLPLFWAARRWYERSYNSRSNISANILLFLGVRSMYGAILQMPLKISEIQAFTPHFFSDRSMDDLAVGLPYTALFTIVVIFIYRIRLRWYWKTAMTTALFAAQFVAWQAGLMVFREGWFIGATILEIGAHLLLIFVLDKLIKARESAAPKLFEVLT